MSTTQTTVVISYSDRAKQYSHFTREWQTGMCGACCSDPLGCLLAIFCPSCFACHLRNEALNKDMTRYRCCQGQVCPSCCSGTCPCPCLCLCLEVNMFFPCAVFSTRQHLKVERQLKDDGCDECLICCAGVLECVHSCVKCINCLTCGMCCCVTPCLDCANHVMTSVVTCCMQAQIHHELRKFPHVNDYDGGDDALLVVSTTNSVNTVQPGYTTAQPGAGYATQPNMMQQKVPLPLPPQQQQPRFDPDTGQPMAQPNMMQQNAPLFDPTTGQPLAAPAHIQAPRFDPTTGQPIAAAKVPMFDPTTGAPLAAPPAEAQRFDPNTGQPMVAASAPPPQYTSSASPPPQRFNPDTGLPM